MFSAKRVTWFVENLRQTMDVQRLTLISFGAKRKEEMAEINFQTRIKTGRMLDSREEWADE